MSKTNDTHRYTLRMPLKYSERIQAEADSIGTSMSAVILRIFAKHYGFIDGEEATRQGNEMSNIQKEGKL